MLELLLFSIVFEVHTNILQRRVEYILMPLSMILSQTFMPPIMVLLQECLQFLCHEHHKRGFHHIRLLESRTNGLNWMIPHNQSSWKNWVGYPTAGGLTFYCPSCAYLSENGRTRGKVGGNNGYIGVTRSMVDADANISIVEQAPAIQFETARAPTQDGHILFSQHYIMQQRVEILIQEFLEKFKARVHNATNECRHQSHCNWAYDLSHGSG